MNTIRIEEPVKYSPNMLVVPNAWEQYSFDKVDFTGKEKLQIFLESYLSRFDYDGADSLIFEGADFVYGLLIAIYREIGSRITADAYRFYSWSEYVAGIVACGNRAESSIMADLLDVNFLFLFDLNFSRKECYDYFAKILNYAYIHNMKIFGCTHTDMHEVYNQLGKDMQKIFKSKVLLIETK